MKSLLLVLVCLLLSGCGESANGNRSYVISKSPIDPADAADDD